MKTKFEEPRIDVIVYSVEDVMTTSDFTPGNNESGMT